MSSAVSALKNVDLPPALDARVAARLAAIIRANAKSGEHAALLVSCIRVFVHRHLTPEQMAGKAGEWLVGVLALHSPEHYARELHFFPKEFGTLPGFGRLVVKSMMDTERMSYGADDVYAALRMLDASALEPDRKDLLDMALTSGDDEGGFTLRGVLVEVFGESGRLGRGDAGCGARGRRCPEYSTGRHPPPCVPVAAGSRKAGAGDRRGTGR